MEFLALEETIADTHDDYAPWGTCVSGFADNKDFIVRYRLENYGKGHEIYEDAVMKPGEAYELAKRMKVHVIDLPKALEEEFGVERNVLTSREAYEVFEDVRDFLLENHIRFRMVRAQKRL